MPFVFSDPASNRRASGTAERLVVAYIEAQKGFACALKENGACESVFKLRVRRHVSLGLRAKIFS